MEKLSSSNYKPMIVLGARKLYKSAEFEKKFHSTFCSVHRQICDPQSNMFNIPSIEEGSTVLCPLLYAIS